MRSVTRQTRPQAITRWIPSSCSRGGGGFEYADPPPGNGGGGGGGGGDGGGGGGAVIIIDPSLKQKAAAFASQHISTNLDMNNANNKSWYEQVHKALSSLYLQASVNPGAIMDGPGSHDMNGAQIKSSLENININLTKSVVGGEGALTHPTASYNGAYIEIGVPQMAAHEAQFDGDKYLGRNYVIFHELGHATSEGLHYAQQNPGSAEAFANSMGYALANLIGEPYPNSTQLSNSGWIPL